MKLINQSEGHSVKKWTARLSLYIVLILSFTTIVTSFPVPKKALAAPKKPTLERSKSEIIVKFKTDAKGENVKTNIKSKLKLNKLEAKKKYKRTKTELVEIGEADDINKIIKELSLDPDVQYVQPNYKLSASAVTDPKFADQWSLLNTGQTVGTQKGTAGLDIKASNAWKTGLGSPSTLVGILDTGVDIHHTDLKNNIFVNAYEIPGNGIDDDNNGFIDDVNGWDFAHDDNQVYDGSTEDKHGTHIAGIIGAEANQEGIRGVAPGVKLLPLKFISGTTGLTSDAIEAIEYAKKMGVKIMNASFGGQDYNAALKDAIATSGIVFISAAGNSGQDTNEKPIYPASFDLPNVISVAAVDNKGKLASFSNYGVNVDIAAPGVGILSTVPDNGYEQASGTSMAAAEVTGAAALVQSVFPDLTAEQIVTRIKAQNTPIQALENVIAVGGIVNANAALEGANSIAVDKPQATTKPAPDSADSAVTTLAASISAQLQEQIHYGEAGVSVASGNFSEKATDLSSTTGDFKLAISHSYNSKDARIGPLGRGWTFGYEGSVADDTTDSTLKVVKLPSGESQVFLKSGTNFIANDSHSTLVKLPDNTYQLSTKEQMVYKFGATTIGYLQSIQDPNGNIVSINTAANGNPLTMTDHTGRIYTVGYNSTTGFLSTITDPIGRVITYGYDATNRLTQVTDSMSNVVANYEYDAQNYLIKWKDGSQNVLETIEYDHPSGTHKVMNYTDKYGMKYTYTYDLANSKTTITDVNGRQIVKWYDAQMFTVKSQDPEGKQVSVDYTKDANGVNKYGEQNYILDRNGNKTQYEWDTNGNIKKITNPDSSYQQFSYDTKNNLLWEKDELGKTTFYVYDSTNTNLIQMIQPLNGTDLYSEASDPTRFAVVTYAYYTNAEAVKLGYKEKGLMKSVTDAEGNTTFYTYDAFGNQTTITDPNLNVTTMQYNGVGWLTSTISPMGYRTDLVYDGNGHIEKKILDQGETTRTLFDIQGREVQEISPNQYKTSSDGLLASPIAHTYTNSSAGDRTEYYPTGKEKKEIDTLGNITQYTYDLYGNMLTKILPNGSQYVYEYDVMNRQKKISFKSDINAVPELQTEYAYTSNVSDGTTQTTETSYLNATETAISIETFDYSGTLLSTLQPDGTKVSTLYNANGTINTSVDENGSRTYFKYDGMNRLTDTWTQVSNGKFMYTGFEYDRNSQKLKEKAGKDNVALYSVPIGDRLVVSTSNYVDGRLYSQVNPLGGKTWFSYDKEKNVIQSEVQTDDNNTIKNEIIYNSTGSPIAKKSHIQTGDLAGMTFGDTRDTVLTTKYTYDLNGNVLTITTPDQVTTNYSYDSEDQQLGISKLRQDENGLPVLITAAATYDAMGNSLTATNANGAVITNEYNTKGWLVKQKDALNNIAIFDYNRVGNKVLKVSKQNYDATKIPTDMNRSEFVYDKMGRLKMTLEKYNEQIYSSASSFSTNWTERVTRSFVYDSNGNVVKELDAEGYKYGVGTTVDTRMSSGYGTENRYDLANRLVSVLDPESKLAGLKASIQYEYDGLGRKITETNANGTISSYYYDDLNHVTSLTVRLSAGAPEQTLKSYTYDLAGRLKTETDANGNITSYSYNALSQLRSTTLPGDATVGENTIQYQYNVMGKLASKKDGLGIVNLYTYDNDSRTLSFTEAKADGKDSITTISKYDKVGNKRYQSDGNGKTTETLYDLLDRPLVDKSTITDVNGVAKIQSTSYTYDKDSNKITETDWVGNTTKYNYDPLNRLVQKVDSNNVPIASYVYNANDAQVKLYDAMNSMTEFRYDRNKRLTQTIDAEGNITRKTYDRVGNINGDVDGNGNVTQYEYDPFSRVTGVTSANNEKNNYTYDGNGNLLTVMDGKGQTVSYEYNARNKVNRKIDQGGRTGKPGQYIYVDSKVQSYTYDANAMMSTKKDRNGNTIRYAYDTHGRVLNKAVSGQNETDLPNAVSYTYDNNGNRLSMSDKSGTKSYTYDEANRVVSRADASLGTSTFLLDQTAGVSSGFTYDLTTDIKGNSTKRTYDKLNRLVDVKNGSDASTLYTYDANGNQKDVTYPNQVKEAFTYNKNNRLKTLVNSLSGVVKDSYAYTYDGNSNQTSKTETTQGVMKGTTNFTYDVLNRLSTVNEPSGKATAFTYDAAGNRESKRVTDGAQDSTTNYSYNEQNRLMSTVETKSVVSRNTTTYTYDPNGNMIRKSLEQTKKVDPSNLANPEFGMFIYGQPNNDPRIAAIVNGTAEYEYDGWNQLIKAKTGTQTLDYSYDGDGYRTSKTVDGQMTRYVYEDGEVSLELDKQGKQLARNVRGTNLISREAGADKMYYVYNGHADVTGMIDAAGKTRATFDYDAFGNPDASRTQYYDTNGSIVTAASATKSPFRYAGYMYDEETDLYYLNSRYYNADIARFISEDTYYGELADPLSLNLYTYVNNEPIMYDDPMGHLPSLSSIVKTVTKAATNTVATVKQTAVSTVAAVKQTAVTSVAAVKQTAVSTVTAIKQTAVKTVAVVQSTATVVKQAAVSTVKAVSNVVVKTETVVNKAVVKSSAAVTKVAVKAVSQVPAAAAVVKKVVIDTPAAAVKKAVTSTETTIKQTAVATTGAVKKAVTSPTVTNAIQKVTKSANDVKLGVIVAADNNMTFGALQHLAGGLTPPNSTSYKVGKVVGDLGTFVAGVAGTLTAAGGVTVGGGVTVASGGTLVVPGALAIAGSIALGAASSSAVASSTSNGLSDIKDLFSFSKGTGNPVKDNMKTRVSNDSVTPPEKKGNAPVSNQDGKPVEIHHEGQNPNGPFHEMSQTDHRVGDNYKKNHPDFDQPSQVDRKEFNKQKKDYWQGEWDNGRWGKK